MRVIIAGSRSLNELGMVYGAVGASGWREDVTEVVCGCAPGVDSLGNTWALERGIPSSKHFPASDYPSPLERNQAMADYADALIAVWDGESRGTKDMVARMLKAEKPVFQVTWTTRKSHECLWNR